MSYADKIFINNIKDILENGYWDTDIEVRPKWEDGTPAHTVKKFGIVNRYDLSKEFPILTIRKINLKAAIDEILWIWQKKSNNIRDLNSHIWDSWADKNGSIGKAYGYQLKQKHIYSEGEFDQVDRVLYDLKNNPQSRRILTNIYNFEDLHEMNLYPCAYSMTFNTSGDTLNGILNQRSNDMVVANNWNVVQYAILLKMFAQVSGLKAGELVHVISDAHIYDRHIPVLEKILEREQYDAPQLVMNENITNFYDFKVEDFELKDYNFTLLGTKLPVAI
jgi:thymidylate synthase